VVYVRYREAVRESKHLILNEFCLNTGYHRKYAIRLLSGPPPGGAPQPRKPRRVSYGHPVVAILASVWEAAGYPWSVRLKALLPLWMPWIRKRFQVSPEMEKQLLRISPRQIDRRLKAKKRQRKRRIYGHTKPGSLLKHHIPVKTDSWDVSGPGFSEIDLVSDSGNSGEGEFAHTLNLTDIHTGWTESPALLGRSQIVVQQALDEIEGVLPFGLLGVDSDNGSEFINWHLKGWCEQKTACAVFTRQREKEKGPRHWLCSRPPPWDGWTRPYSAAAGRRWWCSSPRRFRSASAGSGAGC